MAERRAATPVPLAHPQDSRQQGTRVGMVPGHRARRTSSRMFGDRAHSLLAQFAQVAAVKHDLTADYSSPFRQQAHYRKRGDRLPEPDSPTKPISQRGAIEKLTRSTTRNSPCSVKNEVARSLTSSSGCHRPYQRVIAEPSLSSLTNGRIWGGRLKLFRYSSDLRIDGLEACTTDKIREIRVPPNDDGFVAQASGLSWSLYISRATLALRRCR